MDDDFYKTLAESFNATKQYKHLFDPEEFSPSKLNRKDLLFIQKLSYEQEHGYIPEFFNQDT